MQALPYLSSSLRQFIKCLWNLPATKMLLFLPSEMSSILERALMLGKLNLLFCSACMGFHFPHIIWVHPFLHSHMPRVGDGCATATPLPCWPEAAREKELTDCSAWTLSRNILTWLARLSQCQFYSADLTKLKAISKQEQYKLSLPCWCLYIREIIAKILLVCQHFLP